jgi:Cd2+/Zn2+-exporting ATPase
MQKLKLTNLNYADCALKIEEGLKKLKEVKYVSFNFSDSLLYIETDDLDKVKSTIKKLEPNVIVEELPQKTYNIAGQVDKKELTIIGTVVIIYLLGLLIRDFLHNNFLFTYEYLIFIPCYLLSGWKVLYNAGRKIFLGKFFDEHFLMSIATIGAIIIGQLPEAAGVMIFYQIGEFLQQLSLNKSRRSIKALMELKANYANLKINNIVKKVDPEEVSVNQVIIIKPGEKIPLDGVVIEGLSQLDSSPLTGESVPKIVKPGDEILAGMINKSSLLTLRVTKLFRDSSIKKVIDLIENASAKKAETEKFITKFSRYYTPIVVFAALLIAFIPPVFWGLNLETWIYRALVLLVISCPCALVISIPLGYFGGIGASSRNGILIKGSNFLDTLTEVKTFVFDKTGTLTKGIFKVTQIEPTNGFNKDELLQLAAEIESQSNHPFAQSIREAYNKDVSHLKLENYQEIAGMGIKAVVENKLMIAGNDQLLHKEEIDHPLCNLSKSVVHIAANKKYAGYIIISDELKDDAHQSILNLRNEGIEKIYMLTGDNHYIAESISKYLNLDGFFAELLPEEKVNTLEQLREETNNKIVFIGDGINDAPVITRADVGIAMGALGSDLAIENADVVLMTDKLSKISKAIQIAKRTRKIVWQNIVFALGVKGFFIILGSIGIATMWEAVFADMGVALIAILNSLRVLRH